MDISEYKTLKDAGRKMGRAGISLRIIDLVAEYTGLPITCENMSYMKAIELSGRLHALSLASRSDGYWEEKSKLGFRKEFCDLRTDRFVEKYVNAERED